ncbi:MAG: hypothetical protein ABI681_13690 [Gemmatimonadales bacterium]
MNGLGGVDRSGGGVMIGPAPSRLRANAALIESGGVACRAGC